MIQNVYWAFCKVPAILVRFIEIEFFFLDRFLKNAEISDFMKIRAMGVELFHADRRTHGQT